MSSESVQSFTEDNLLEVLGLGLVGPDTKATCVGQTEENTRCQNAVKKKNWDKGTGKIRKLHGQRFDKATLLLKLEEAATRLLCKYNKRRHRGQAKEVAERWASTGDVPEHLIQRQPQIEATIPIDVDIALPSSVIQRQFQRSYHRLRSLTHTKRLPQQQRSDSQRRYYQTN